jgi:hypothetical protein
VLAKPSRLRGLSATLAPGVKATLQGKIVSAWRRNQHAKRVRYPKRADDAARDIRKHASHNLRVKPLADRYAEICAAVRVHERALFVSPRIPNELELQARWFAGDFGKHFISTTGDKIDIVQFGTWNREAGPDFRDAAIRINDSDPIRGCIEIDLLDRSWEAHGHATNPAFEETALHVFVEKSGREFFTRTRSNRNVPQVCIDLTALPNAFSANIPLARPGRCQAPLKDLPEKRVSGVLAAAAQFRLQQKATRIRSKIETHGRDEALFQEIATALGYKENKLPFTLIAQRLLLKLLREKIEDCEALLFGVAGFLEAPDLSVFKRSTQKYVRTLWDRWWPHRDAMRRMILPAKVWRMSGTRPMNHPQRRLAALAMLVQKWPAFRRATDVVAVFRLPSPQPSPQGRGSSASGRGQIRTSAAEQNKAPLGGSFSSREKVRMRVPSDFLGALEHPFWNFHYTLTSEASPKKMALIGESRVADILANVLFPSWLAEDVEVWPAYAQLPARLSNRRLETAATRLFGSDSRRRAFTKSIANQQGLLQIYEDFCMQDNSDCAQCPFPEQMAKWQ